MDPQLENLLKQNLELAKENNRMLRAMRRNQWLGFWGKLIFWIIIIVAPLYFLQPYLSSLPSAAEVQNIFNQYKLMK